MFGCFFGLFVVVVVFFLGGGRGSRSILWK